MEIASLPNALKITVCGIPRKSPIAINRPIAAGKTFAVMKNAPSARSAKSSDLLARLACRFGSSQTIFTIIRTRKIDCDQQ